MPSRLFALGLLVTLSVPLAAQDGSGLRSLFADLFTFGPCGASTGMPQICLADLTGVHGDHFIEAAELSGATAQSFITNAITANISNVPIPSTGGGATFEFVDGLPVRTEASAGPIFAERAETLGRGRVLAGTNVTLFSLNSIRGIPLDNLIFNFAHEDGSNPGLGDPGFENDVIQMQSSLDVNVFVATAYANIGVSDYVDVGVAIPFVRVSVNGNGTGTILPVSGTVLHYFAGNPTDPTLVATSAIDGSASGIGDIAGRLKIHIPTENTDLGVGFIGEVRIPTGDEENLLGTGKFAARLLGILSGRMNNFSPHVNFGFFYRNAEMQTNSALLSAGFDQLLAPWATVAVDLVSDWQLGSSQIELPPQIQYSSPSARSLDATIIPDRRDDLINGSVGVKLSPNEYLTLILNAFVPLGNGGVQPNATWTGGFELHF